MRATASTEWGTVLSVTSLTTHRIPGNRRVVHHIVYGCSLCHSANPAQATVSERPEAGYAPAAAAARTPALRPFANDACTALCPIACGPNTPTDAAGPPQLPTKCSSPPT